jgi:hypothetical protein
MMEKMRTVRVKERQKERGREEERGERAVVCSHSEIETSLPSSERHAPDLMCVTPPHLSYGMDVE